jgi:hypothetical protein
MGEGRLIRASDYPRRDPPCPGAAGVIAASTTLADRPRTRALEGKPAARAARLG